MPGRPNAKALRAWDALCEDFAKGEGAAADWSDPHAPDEWMRTFSFTASAARPRTLLYFTKGPSWLAHWKQALPDDVELIVHWGLVTAHQAERVRCEALRCRRHVRFVGDLDPQDLATYLSLAFGDYRMRPRRSAVPIDYAGITDAWVDAAESSLLRKGDWPRSFLDFAPIEMTDAEKRYLHVVEQLGPMLDTWVGPRCASLLRSGKKLEIEAIFNSPDLYPASYATTRRGLFAGTPARRSPRASKR